MEGRFLATRDHRGGLRLDGPAHRAYANDEAVQIGLAEYRLPHFFATPRDAFVKLVLTPHQARLEIASIAVQGSAFACLAGSGLCPR